MAPNFQTQHTGKWNTRVTSHNRSFEQQQQQQHHDSLGSVKLHHRCNYAVMTRCIDTSTRFAKQHRAELSADIGPHRRPTTKAIAEKAPAAERLKYRCLRLARERSLAIFFFFSLYVFHACIFHSELIPPGGAEFVFPYGRT